MLLVINFLFGENEMVLVGKLFLMDWFGGWGALFVVGEVVLWFQVDHRVWVCVSSRF